MMQSREKEENRDEKISNLSHRDDVPYMVKPWKGMTPQGG